MFKVAPGLAALLDKAYGEILSGAPYCTDVDDSERPWMLHAESEAELRVTESAGESDNPRILEYHKSTTVKDLRDEVPWCSSFVNWCLKEAGIQGTDSAGAASWTSWGQASIASGHSRPFAGLMHEGQDRP